MGAIIFLAICAVIGIIIWIWSSYDKKVKDILNHFRKNTKQFYQIAEGYFEAKTNGRKISKWDKEHTIDFIINENAKSIIESLKTYNDLKIWWIHEMPKVKKSSYDYAEMIASDMFILGSVFQTRAKKEIDSLLEYYNPENITFKLYTYTYYEAGERHYNPYTSSYTDTGSTRKNITFAANITPDETYERIQFLSKYNFSITKYQFECDNQRSLMTQELRNKIIARDKRICQNCGKLCDYSDIEIDHIQPVSKGGKTIESNLQVLCVSCNRKKSNKWLDSVHSQYFNNKTTQTNFNNQKTDKKEENLKEKQTTQTAKKINWVLIQSQTIKDTYYNKQTLTLYIRLRNGDIYKYNSINQQTYLDFLCSPSKESTLMNELTSFNHSKISLEDII